MTRALIQPMGGSPAPSAARASRRVAGNPTAPRPALGRNHTTHASPQTRPVRLGFGLLVAAGASLSLWGAAIWLVSKAFT